MRTRLDTDLLLLLQLSVGVISVQQVKQGSRRPQIPPPVLPPGELLLARFILVSLYGYICRDNNAQTIITS